MASPKPVPSVVVFFSISNLSNLSNSLLIFSALIPRPVSLTVIIKLQMLSLFMHFTFNSISPCLVNLIALVSKLLITSFI